MLWNMTSRFRPFVLFDADGSGDAGGGGGGSGSGEAGNNPAPSNGGNNNQDVVRQFKQSELDAMIAERARHAKSAAISDFLKELGMESSDGLKDALKRLADLENKDKTDLEKLADENKNLKTQIDQEKQRADEVVKAASEKLMRAEVMAEAQRQGIRSDAIVDVWMFVDQSTITEKDGKFEGVKEAVEAVVKAKPYLLESGTKGHGTPPRAGNNSGSQGNNMQPQQKPSRPITL